MDGEPAPAGADLEQVIRRREVELAADALEFRDLCLVQRRVGAFENAARIRHRLVEEQCEQVVAEIVVRGDVAPAAVGTVAVQPVQHAAQRRRRDRRAAFHGLHDVAVGDEQADERSQVVAAPVAAHEGLAAADRTAECRIRVGLRVEHLDGRMKAAVFGALAERPALAALDDGESRHGGAARAWRGRPVGRAAAAGSRVTRCRGPVVAGTMLSLM